MCRFGILAAVLQCPASTGGVRVPGCHFLYVPMWHPGYTTYNRHLTGTGLSLDETVIYTNIHYTTDCVYRLGYGRSAPVWLLGGRCSCRAWVARLGRSIALPN